MSSHDDERRRPGREGTPAQARPPQERTAEALPPEEGRFVAKLVEGYAPEPMTPARRADFDADLRARIEGRRSRWHPPAWQPKAALWVPAAAAAALAAVWLFSLDRGPVSAPSTAPTVSTAAWDWEEALLEPDLVADLESADTDDETYGDELPEEYLAIASAFL